jgi:hypothetical protein
MRNRLKRSGIFRRKLGLKRMRSAKLLSGGALVAEVYPELAAVGTELERMHPKLFERVGRQIGCGALRSEQRVTEALTDVAREMLRSGECSWEKIVALYAIAGGMAVDCVRQGKPEFLVAIQRAMAMVLEEDLAAWIQANGGWVGVLALITSPSLSLSSLSLSLSHFAYTTNFLSRLGGVTLKDHPSDYLRYQLADI